MAKYKDINYINISDIDLEDIIVNEIGDFILENDEVINNLIYKLDEFKSDLENHKQEHINKKTSEKLLDILNSDSEESEILRNIFNKNSIMMHQEIQ